MNRYFFDLKIMLTCAIIANAEKNKHPVNAYCIYGIAKRREEIG